MDSYPLLDYLLYTATALSLLFIAYAGLFTLLALLRRSGLDQLPAFKLLTKLLVILFVLADWWVNLVISLLMLDLPAHARELVTGRLKRYKKEYQGTPPDQLGQVERWRLGFAVFLCRQLNRYDPEHC